MLLATRMQRYAVVLAALSHRIGHHGAASRRQSARSSAGRAFAFAFPAGALAAFNSLGRARAVFRALFMLHGGVFSGGTPRRPKCARIVP